MLSREKVDAETKRLVDLFAVALWLPDHPGDRYPRDCPLCGATDTFTLERVEFIREKVKATETYANATKSFQSAFQSLNGQLDALSSAALQAQPKFMLEPAAERRAAGFRIAGISKLVPDQPIIKAWFDGVCRLGRIAVSRERLGPLKLNYEPRSPALSDGPGRQREESLVAVQVAQIVFEGCLEDYKAPAKALGEPLKAAVDQSADTKGWDSLISISRDQGGLWESACGFCNAHGYAQGAGKSSH